MSKSIASAAVGRSPLLRPEWSYIEKSQEHFCAADWALLNRRRAEYYAEQQAKQALRMLNCLQDDASFGYQINTYAHCLQSATLALRAGLDDETIVVALFHDLGFVTCPETHGEFVATMLKPYISEKNHWMLVHHGVFQNYHCFDYPGLDRHARERWRDHPYFDWTAEFVAHYDQDAMRPDYPNEPLAVFEPLVYRLFARPAMLENRDGGENR